MYDVKGEYVVMTLGEVCITLEVWQEIMADVIGRASCSR